MGLAVALLVLAGGAIVFAGGGLNAPRQGGPGATGSFAALPAPQILTPEVVLTRDATMDLTLIRPSGLDGGTDFTVRITVNGDKALERPLPDQEQFVIAGIPLTEGENSIRAALLEGTTLGATSAAMTVTRDTTAPVIRVSKPEPGATVYTEKETLRGRTEAGATIAVSDGFGNAIASTIDPDGRFTAELSLLPGANDLLLSSRDLAGNTASTHITIDRAQSSASLSLDVADDSLKLTDLPQTLTATAYISDEQAHLVDGAQVTFSLSPPNATTLTYRTVSVSGTATWTEIKIPSGEDSRGSWLMTVLVELPSGTELRANKTISVR